MTQLALPGVSFRRKPGRGFFTLRPLRARAPAFAGVTALLLSVLAAPAFAQADEAPTLLSGTLAKVQRTGEVTIGYRESSIPFSYLSARNEPIGYSIDLCRQLVDAIGGAVGRAVAIRWEPVTSDTRIAAVTSGRVDLECGSTTSNLERQKVVAFSAGDVRLRHQADGPQGFADPVVSRPSPASASSSRRVRRTRRRCTTSSRGSAST